MPRPFGGVLAALFAFGCGCLSEQQVRAKLDEMLLENRTRAEPAMLEAAKSRGAVLLPLEPEDVGHRLPCVSGTDEAERIPEPIDDYCLLSASERPGCEEASSDGRMQVIREKGEHPKLVVPVREVDGAIYARLARNGNRLFVLLPRLTSKEEVGSYTECLCDGMPHPYCASTFGFLLEDAPESPVLEEIRVPMAEEHLRRECKTIGL